MILVQVLFISLLIAPVLWGLFNWFRHKNLSYSGRTASLATLINSAVLYAIAFNVIFFFQELFLVLGKKVLGLKSFLYHNNHIWEGEHPLDSLMQGSGALAIFIIGLILLLAYRFIRGNAGMGKLFVLWLSFHGLMQSIPQVPIGYLQPQTDVGQALIAYLKLSDSVLIILSVISITAIPFLAFIFAKRLLEFAPPAVDIKHPKAKFKYLGIIAVGAGLIGSILIVPFRIMPISQAITPFVVFVFSVPWIWSSGIIIKNVGREANKINDKIFWLPVIFLIGLLIFFQLVLAPGVEF